VPCEIKVTVDEEVEQIESVVEAKLTRSEADVLAVSVALELLSLF
jgi:hypothetical protein